NFIKNFEFYFGADPNDINLSSTSDLIILITVGLCCSWFHGHGVSIVGDHWRGVLIDESGGEVSEVCCGQLEEWVFSYHEFYCALTEVETSCINGPTREKEGTLNDLRSHLPKP
ncbi:hypothetical protein ACH5RR_006965, partial [Cinchona calisaya]